MGGFFNIGGSSAKTDRSNVLTGFSNLKNLFNWGLPTAETGSATGRSLTGQGASTLGDAANYFKSLISGNRSALLRTVAPEAGAVQQQSDAQKRQLATSGTSRGGGVAGVNQQRDTDTMAAVDRLLFGVRPGAAQELAQTGAAIGNLGLGQQSVSNQLAAVAGNAATDLTKNAITARQIDFEINKQVQQDVVNAVMGAITGFMNPASVGV